MRSGEGLSGRPDGPGVRPPAVHLPPLLPSPRPLLRPRDPAPRPFLLLYKQRRLFKTVAIIEANFSNPSVGI